MSRFSALLRRLRDLVARLLGRAAPDGATVRAALPAGAEAAAPPAPAPADASPPAPVAAPVAAPVPAPVPMAALVPAEVAAAIAAALPIVPATSPTAGLTPRVIVEPIDDPPPFAGASESFAEPESRSSTEPRPRAEPGEAMVAGARPVLTVRRFFAQVAAAAPGGLTLDFSTWQGATVDRFFLALTAPERTRRRGPALAESSSISGAFDGFEWD